MGFSLGGLLPPILALPVIPAVPPAGGPTPTPPPTQTASPPPAYEPSPPEPGEPLTYSPPSSGSGATSPDAETAPATDGGNAPVTVAASSSRVRTQFGRNADLSGPSQRSPELTQSLSVQVAAATQPLQVRQTSQSAHATLPTAQNKAEAPAEGALSQSQVTAQAAYTLIADAFVQDRNLLDLVKYA